MPSGTGQKGMYELHTYPVGVVDHALGLVGNNGGLLQLTDVTMPASTTFPVGTTCDWTSFSLGGSRDPDTEGDTLQYNGAKGKWVAFPGASGTWKVTWLTGETLQPSERVAAFSAADFLFQDLPLLSRTISRSTSSWRKLNSRENRDENDGERLKKSMRLISRLEDLGFTV